MDEKANSLREKAKEELRKKGKIDQALFETDLKVLVEELSIYQIELEHQNLQLLNSQEQLEESKNRYLDLFDNAPVGYIIVDSNYKIKVINQTACNLLGVVKNDCRNTKFTKFIHPDFQDTFYLYFRALIKPEPYSFCDIKLQKPNNAFFYAHVQGIREAISIRNDFEFRLAIIDISVQKELEFKLQQETVKAVESDRLKSAFLSNMSHEIRTPMNGILGFAGLLKEPNLTKEEQQDFINTINISGIRMLNTINNIVDISKIESGLTQVNIAEVNINDQIESIYNFFKPEAEGKGISFSFLYNLSSVEAIIKTDREKIYGILTNLIKNAMKFTNSGSVEFGYKNKGKYLEFFIKDTGIGISETQKKLVFERFRRGNELITSKYEGTGLGLSISKSYVEMLGGRIWVESEEGKGSIFYFTIPVNYGSVEVEKTKKTVSKKDDNFQKRSLNIMVVEDDATSYSLLNRFLQKENHKVLHARTGAEAIALCNRNPEIELILMDIKMPVMDGYEATRQIRQFNKEVIIIAQTAFAFSGDRETASEAGCNDYISKPINYNLLKELIEQYTN